MRLPYRVLLNAIVLAALLAMQPLTFSYGFTRLAPFYAAVLIALRIANPKTSDSIPLLPSPSSYWLVGVAAGFATMHIARESADYATFVGDSRFGIKMAIVELATAGTLLFLTLRTLRGEDGALEFITTVAIGISLFIGLNVFLETTGLMVGEVGEGFQSRYVEGALRWMPPLTKSNGLFSYLNRYAAAMLVVVLLFYWRRLPWMIRAVALSGLLVQGYAAILLEHRATLIPLAVAPFAYWAASRKHAVFVPMSMLAAMVIIPIIIGTGIWREQVATLIPASVMQLAGDPDTVIDLSGREAIYEYGLERMKESSLPLMGDGPIFRDSFPGFRNDIRDSILDDGNRITDTPRTFGFHNGFLDAVIIYGIPSAGLFLLLLLIACVSFGVQGRTDALMLGSTSLAVLLAVSVVDGGFSDPTLLFLTLFGAAFSGVHAMTLAAAGRQRRQALLVAGSRLKNPQLRRPVACERLDSPKSGLGPLVARIPDNPL